MAQRLVLHDFTAVGAESQIIELKAGTVIEDTAFPNLAELQAGGLAVSADLAGLPDTVAANARYQLYKASRPLEDRGAHLIALMIDQTAITIS